LQREQDLLQTSEYAEKIAREKFGMAKDNEDIYYVVPDTSEAKKKGADQKENEKDRRRQ